MHIAHLKNRALGVFGRVTSPKRLYHFVQFEQCNLFSVLIAKLSKFGNCKFYKA